MNHVDLQSLRAMVDTRSSHALNKVNIVNNVVTYLRMRSVDKYPAKSHARRVADKLGVANGLVVLSATRAALWPNSDMPVPFRQDRYFYYLTGCNEPGCYVTYEIEADKLTLWLPPINKARVVWTGRGSTVEEACYKYDIDDAKYIKPKRKEGKQCKNADDSAHDANIPEWIVRQIKHESVFRCPTTIGPYQIYGLTDLASNYVLSDLTALREAMIACRVIKDEHEIELIRRANTITTEAHIHVMRNLHSFSNEAAVEAAYMQTCITRKAKEQAYAPIVGAGANGSVLHYSENQADFGDGQTVVIDAGCEVSCYASDVTRTLPLNKHNPGHWPSEEAREIYGLVEEVQEACIAHLKPGASLRVLTGLAVKLITKGLLKLGILKGDEEDVLHAGTALGFFPHGLGHHVGLEVHDVAPAAHPRLDFLVYNTPEELDDAISRAREAQATWSSCAASTPAESHRPAQTHVSQFVDPETEHSRFGDGLKAAMVVTVEPGVYFNQYLLKQFFLDHPVHSQNIDRDVLKRYMPVGGVRIEDDILITKTGFENLTTTPKGKEMLKIIQVGAEHAKKGSH